MSTSQLSLFDAARTPGRTRIPEDVTRRKHGGNAQSIAANPTREAKLSDQSAIIAYLRTHGDGTVKDFASALGKGVNRVSGRVTELSMSDIVWTGQIRDRCRVWKLRV
jgi:hypothetical protein